MKKILVEATENGLSIASEYNKSLLKQMVKDGTKLFELVPRVRASKKQTGYLEGAVIPCYAQWQYNLDPRDPKTKDVARTLFKQDFWYAVIKDRNGNPKKTLRSFKGQQVHVLDKYTEWAQENGGPVPNEKLYLTWRDEWSMEPKWESFYDWLDYLGLEQDAMPSAEYIEQKLTRRTL